LPAFLDVFACGMAAAYVLAWTHARVAHIEQIIRAGILSVDQGQSDAGAAIGLRRPTVMRKIILPQAMRLIIPPAANNFIGLLKATALISVIAGSDLLTEAQVIYTQNFQVISLLIVAAIWYLVLVGLATLGQQYLERKFSQQAIGGRRRVIARVEEAL
jgi:polar amino acid transport system permease protein